jgi:hypothetical protein
VATSQIHRLTRLRGSQRLLQLAARSNVCQVKLFTVVLSPMAVALLHHPNPESSYDVAPVGGCAVPRPMSWLPAIGTKRNRQSWHTIGASRDTCHTDRSEAYENLAVF